MEKQTVKFKVAMDAEAKKAGDVKNVNLTVNFEGIAEADIVRAALQAQVVSWQSQIRTHWTEFQEGKLPEEITFGQPLFESRKVRTIVAPVTEVDVKKYIQQQLADGKSIEDILGNA